MLLMLNDIFMFNVKCRSTTAVSANYFLYDTHNATVCIMTRSWISFFIAICYDCLRCSVSQHWLTFCLPQSPSTLQLGTDSEHLPSHVLWMSKSGRALREIQCLSPIQIRNCMFFHPSVHSDILVHLIVVVSQGDWLC